MTALERLYNAVSLGSPLTVQQLDAFPWLPAFIDVFLKCVETHPEELYPSITQLLAL